MSLDAALVVARSGLRLLDRQMARASDDIANAGTEGHTRKVLQGRALEADGSGIGVRGMVAARDVDLALISAADRARSESAAAELTERLLSGVESVHGRPEDGDSLAGRLAGLRGGFVLLQEAPADSNRRSGALEAARALAAQFNTVAGAIGEARQAAQDALVEEVGAVNAALSEVARLNIDIRREIAAGRGGAALEDQRDQAIARVAESLELRVIRRASGEVTLLARGGLVLPLRADGAALRIDQATVGPGAYHGGGLPGVLLDGQDVTRQLAGGRMAAAATARDATLPRLQAELDLAAAHVAQRFQAQGLTLFTDGAGAVPDVTQPYAGSLQLGFAGVMRVNQAVIDNPGLLRDGTDAVAGLPGEPTAFTPNPPGGPAGFATMVARVLDHVFGTTLAPGVAHAAIPATGLGPDGTLSTTLSGLVALEDHAAALVTEQSALRAEATDRRGRADSLGEVLGARLAERSGVDVDKEVAAMVELQTAYGVNARVISTIQAMWDALFGAVR
jgi:flagellar hook-associated protein 1 FlgK